MLHSAVFLSLCLYLVTGMSTTSNGILCGPDEVRCNETVPCISNSSTKAEKEACLNSKSTDETDITCSTNRTCLVFVNFEQQRNASNYTEKCIEEFEICDGVSHCSSGEDEENCACPDGCTRCRGSSYRCRPENLPEIPHMAKSIDISGYKIMDVGILCNETRKYLEILDVSSTKIQTLKCLEDTVYFPALKELDVSSNSITVLSNLKLPALTTIRLDNNPIQKLHFLSAVKMSIKNANIKRMEWIINEKDVIAPLAFKPIINYTEPDPMGAKIECKINAFDLSYNNMPLLDTIGHCQSLKDLNLARNKITELDFWSFNGMQYIEKVDLSYNWLESIAKSNFFLD